MAEDITSFLEGLSPDQIREYRRRLQAYDLKLRAEIKDGKKDTEKMNEITSRKNAVGEKFVLIEKLIKNVVAAKSAYRAQQAASRGNKNIYNSEYLEKENEQAERDYRGKCEAAYREFAENLNDLKTAIEERHSTLDLSDPAYLAAVGMIQAAGKNLDAHMIKKINANFKNNQPALKALRAIYKTAGMDYDGGLSEQIYDVGLFADSLANLAYETFYRDGSLNDLAKSMAKLADYEGFDFVKMPDPDGAMEAVRQAAGLPAAQSEGI